MGAFSCQRSAFSQTLPVGFGSSWWLIADSSHTSFDRQRCCSLFAAVSDRSTRPHFRFTALLGVLCVLALGIFAGSPDLHAWAHHTDASHANHAVPVNDAEHVCAVTLFANGLLALALFCLLLLLAPLARDGVVRAFDEIAAAEPRYRLLPAQAPPAA